MVSSISFPSSLQICKRDKLRFMQKPWRHLVRLGIVYIDVIPEAMQVNDWA